MTNLTLAERMMTFLKLLLFITVLPLCVSAQEHWIEQYYECVCYSGERIECLKRIQARFPDFREFSAGNQAANPSASIMLSQVRAAQLTLDQRTRNRPEESACIEKATNILGHALIFSVRERMESKNESEIYVRALHGLSREVFQWAEQNCFNQSGAPEEPLPLNLPNPRLCRPVH